MSLSWTESRAGEISAVLERYPRPLSAIMPLLHMAQEERGGYLTAEDCRAVAEILEVTPAYVESVASFYTLYRRERPGRYILTLCSNLSCGLLGAESLVAHLERRLGVKAGGTTPDGLFTLELTSECLAACDGAPCLQVNHTDYHLHVTPEKADGLVEALRERAGTDGREANGQTAPGEPTAAGEEAAPGGPPPGQEGGPVRG